jgi:two-component system NarL family sensor kinase
MHSLAVIAVIISAIVNLIMIIILRRHIAAKRGLLAAQELERDVRSQEMDVLQKEVQRNTLEEITLEMHDNFGSIISTMSVELHLALRDATGEHKERLESIKELNGQLLREVRTMMKNLENRETKINLLSQVEREVSRINRSGVIGAELKVEGHQRDIPGGTALILLRVVQESLTNALQHAKATIIYVNMHFEDAGIRLEIRDNGIGFDTDAEKDTSMFGRGHGLENMRNRMRILGGNLKISSKIGEGTQILLQAPLVK